MKLLSAMRGLFLAIASALCLLTLSNISVAGPLEAVRGGDHQIQAAVIGSRLMCTSPVSASSRFQFLVTKTPLLRYAGCIPWQEDCQTSEQCCTNCCLWWGGRRKCVSMGSCH